MNKIIYLFLAATTFYLAGMYRYMSLMVLFAMEMVLFVVSFLLSRYFKSSLSIEALRHSDAAGKEIPLVCRFKTHNKGMLPISRFAVRYRCGYRQYQEKATKWVYGGSERGENILEFEGSLSYCGMAYLQMDKIKLYDYLSLFAAAKKKQEEMEIVVFPEERALHIEMLKFIYQENMLQQGQAARRGQDAHNEIRQLREYRAGDSNRHIHWKQSARMEELLVKEYEKETDYQVELFLDMEGFLQAKLSERDAFYELVSALVLGFLQNAAAVRVYWYDGQSKCVANMGVANASQCRDMLLELYRLRFDTWDDVGKAELERLFLQRGSAFKLNMQLCWYWDDLLFYQFSRENLEEEINHKLFTL